MFIYIYVYTFTDTRTHTRTNDVDGGAGGWQTLMAATSLTELSIHHNDILFQDTYIYINTCVYSYICRCIYIYIDI